MVKGLSRLLACAFLRLLCGLLQCVALRGIQPLARWLAPWARLLMMLALDSSHGSCLLSGDYVRAAVLRDAVLLADLEVHSRSG